MMLFRRRNDVVCRLGKEGFRQLKNYLSIDTRSDLPEDVVNFTNYVRISNKAETWKHHPIKYP